MNEQLLKDFIATAQKYNYNWNKAFGLFPELKGYDQQLLKDYVATAEKNNYDYKKVNSLFPELGFNQEPVKKKDSTVLESKSEKPTSGSSTKQDDFYKGGLGESKSTKKTEPKKQASMSYEFKTYTGYPGKEKNEYRVSDGNWVRRQQGEKNWVTITNEGSINALNNQFNQNIKPFESKDEVSKVKDYNNLNKQFQQNLSFVNSKLVDKSEEEVVPKLQRLFPAFTFEQSRAGADRVMVTAPNGKKEEFLLDNYTWSSDKAEADRLKGWMSGNYDAKVAKEEAELRRVEKTAEDKVERTVLPGGGSVTTVTPSFVDRDTAFPIIEEQAKKERADYYKAKSEQVKEIYDKYSNSKSGVKDFEATQAFAELKADDAEIKRLNAYQDDIKMDIQDYASKKQKAATYLNEADGKLRRGEITQEQYDLQYKPQIEEMEAELKDQQSRIQSQTGNIDLVKKAAERAAAENYIIQESKGSFGGGLAFSAVKGMTALPRLALGIMGIESKDLADQMAKDLGLFTTREYIQSENRADLAKAAFSLTESLVAMQSGGPALGGLALYGMGYYELKDELDQVEGMTEQEKMIMAGAYGIVSAALERFGIESAVGKISSSTGKSLKMGIMKEVFSSLPKNASKEVIEAAVINSTKKYLTSAGLNIVGGAVVEGTTEALQSLSSAGIKELYDLGKETDYFNNEGASKVFEDALYEGYLGALGGTIMSGVYNTAQVGVRELKANSNELKLLMQAAETEGMDSAVLASVKADMLSGKITKEQAKTIVDNFQDVKSKVDQMPDGISTDGKSVALSLMTERDELNKQIAGKDPNLVKPQTDRISEINNSLQQIPIDYAVQEQGADAVSVQSGTGVSTEMEEGVSEAKPEGVTGEKPKAEQPKAEVAQEIVQSEENQALIDDYVKKQTDFINTTTVLNQEDKQELIDELVSDPIAYAEKGAGKSEIFGDTPHTDLLNSLQRQPAAETATTEKLTVNPSEGYSFEYESENDIPAELKGVEPTGRTETKVGRGKNAKTKLKLTFTGQQLIDAGLAVTPEAQEQTPAAQEAGVAEVVQPEVQETVQAEPTAKIETIEVQEVPQVEQTLDDLTQQNNVLTQNDFTAARIRNAGKEKVVAQIAKAAKAIAKVLPKVKIVVHATPEAFVEATKDMDGRLSEGGLYDQQTGEIHINLEIANNRTVAHEVFHALILSMVKSDVETQRLTRSMIGAVRKSLKKAEGTAELMSYLEDFENNYDENIKNEEKLAELFAILADNYKQLPPASKNVIIRFLNRLAKALGLKEMTDREAIAFMNTLSRKVETGQEIEAREVGKQKEGKAAVRKQIIGEVGAKKLDQQENSNLRMKNLKVANDMKDAGKTPKEIRTATGWEMGAEGKWRYETVDNLPFFKDTVRAIKEMQAENNLTFLNNVPANLVIPQELIKMYPELNDYTVDFGTGNENEGNVNFDKKRIEVNIGLYPKNTVSTLLHEIQHVIQEIEGFDSGTNTQEIIDEFLAQDNALKRRINMLKKYSPDSPLLDAARNNRKAFIDNFSTVNKNNERVLDKFNLYMRKAGEIEARNVEARMNMTAEERRNTLLTETEDIKDRQIIETAPRKFAVRKQKGLINLTDQEAVKYARAGVENKYDAQAIKQIGLQGTKFDKTSILDRIQKEFDGLVKNTTDYIFREDSPAIDQAIQNEIDTMVDQGYSNDQIERAKRAFKPGPERDNVINEYRRAQVETANQWERYLGQSDYTPAFKYLILDAVLTNNYDLKTDRYQKRTAKTIRNFTPFDAGTLAELYMSESNELLKDYVRIQADNSANIVESAAFSSTKDGKWIKFDGGGNVGEQELQDNANKLSQLVQNTYWCTKTNALSQLRGGDFYVYVTENKQGDFDPRIAVRMNGDEVGEVRGNASSKQDLEADMLPVADTFLREKIPNDSGKKWLDSIAYNTKVKDLTDKIDNKVLDMNDVNEYIDILKDKDKFSVDYGENGLVQTLQDKFRDAKFSFGVAERDSDINDDTLLLFSPNGTFEFIGDFESKNVQVVIGNVRFYEDFNGGKIKTITGDVEFGSDSSAKEIKSIEYIGGYVNFKESNIRNLGSLKEIGGRATFRDSKVIDLGNLKTIGDVADFRDSEVRSLDNLEFIGGFADFYNSSIQDLGLLKEIGGSADFQYSSIESLDGLKKIGKNIFLENSNLKDLGELTEIGNDINVNYTNIKSLGKLKKVGGSLYASSSSKLNDLGSLTEVRENLFLRGNNNIKSLGKLKKVGRNLNISESFVEDLGDLESIGGIADFDNSKVKNLGKLKKVGRRFHLMNSEFEDLGDLESIGGGVSFDDSKVKNLGKLKEIGGFASFEGSNVEDLGSLESIGGNASFDNSKVEDLGNLQFVGGGVSFQGKPELKEQWEQRQGSQFAVRKQKTTGPNRIVENGVKAGKTDAEIRQEGKAAGFTNKEMTEALSKYYTKEQKVFMKSGVKGLVGRFVDGARRFKQKYLTTKGLLPKIGFTYKEKMEGEISAEANRAAKTAKKFGVMFDKFTGDKDLLLEAFDKSLRGDKSIQLPAGFAGLANEMRNHIDRLSQMLIATGAVEGDMADAIRDNMGTYITRSYEIFDNKNFRQKVGEQELQAAKNFLRTQPGMIALAQAEANRTGTTVDEALDVLVDNKIDEYFADAETGALVKGSKLGSKDLSTLKERKEIPEQIRMLMGEYSDPAMNYARTVLNIASLAARHQFLTQVKEAGMGKFFFEKNDSQRPKGFDTEIASEGSDTMSPLNGLMTTPEIAEAFGLYNGQQGEDTWVQQAIKIYYKAMGLVKWLKTIGSVGTHAKNIFSNFTFVGVNGHSLIEIGKAIKVVAQDLKTMSKPEVEAKIDEYIKAGIMRQGAGINEIRDMFKDADMDGFLERRLSMKKRKGVMGKIRQAISSRSSKIVAAMEDAYQAEDDMFKIAAYETEMNRYADALYNKSKDQLTDKERQEVSDIAANNVKNTYPTYSRIPEGIKRLRRFPLFIGSFISFQAESYRTAYNTIALAKDELSSKNKKIKGIGARRVAGASAYLTAKTAILSYLGYAAGTGIGGVLGALFDDDDEKKKEKDVRSFLPPWSQNSDLIILKAADGEIEYIDFSASDAHGGINKALNAFLKGDDLLDSFKQSTLELVGQFQGPDILTNLAIQLKGNENDFGKPIYNEEDSFAEKTDKILDYVYKVVEPGTITSIRKAAASEQSLGQIAFGDATGLKVRKSDVKEQFGYKLAEFDESFKDIRKIYNSEYYKSLEMYEDPKATKKDIKDQNTKTDEALVRANEKYASKAKELMDLINSANRLGVDYDELINELGFIKSTMGKSNISEMENGGDEFIKEKEY